MAIGLSVPFSAISKTIELAGMFVNTSTTTSPSGNQKTVKINCALVSTSVCATITVPDYVVPGTTPQVFPLEGDVVQAGQVFHLQTPTNTETGTFINISQTTNAATNEKLTEIEAEEIDYDDFPTAPAKFTEVIGLYQTMTTTDGVIVNTGDGPVVGSQTKVYCAMVSNSVCFTMETPDLSIPQTLNPQTHNGPLPKGYYRALIVNGATISGAFYCHYQNFTDGTMSSREHTFQYVPIGVAGE